MEVTMKYDLSKWNPFKFMRKSPDEKRNESQAPLALATAAGGMPATWPDLSRLFSADPFRLMQEVTRDPMGGLGQLDRWFGDFSPSMFQPRTDVVEDSNALSITAELPGMDRGDVEILAEDDALILRGEKRLETKSEEKGCYRVERAFGNFLRVIPLPEGTDLQRAEAKFDKGVLTIRVPKGAPAKSDQRRIEIK